MKELVFLPDREGRDEFASVSGLVRLGADGDTLQKLSDRLVLPAEDDIRPDPAMWRGVLALALLSDAWPQQDVNVKIITVDGTASLFSAWVLSARPVQERRDALHLVVLEKDGQRRLLGIANASKGLTLPATATDFTGFVPDRALWFDAESGVWHDPVPYLNENERAILLARMTMMGLDAPEAVAFKADLADADKPAIDAVKAGDADALSALSARIQAVCALKDFDDFTEVQEPCAVTQDNPLVRLYAAVDVRYEAKRECSRYLWRGIPFARTSAALGLTGAEHPEQAAVLAEIDRELALLAENSTRWNSLCAQAVTTWLMSQDAALLPESRAQAEIIRHSRMEKAREIQLTVTLNWPWDASSGAVRYLLKETLGDGWKEGAANPFADYLTKLTGHVLGDNVLQNCCACADGVLLPPLSREMAKCVAAAGDGEGLALDMMRFEPQSNGGITASFLLRGAGEIRMVRTYPVEEIMVLEETAAPCVAVWPCLPMERWRAYHVFLRGGEVSVAALSGGEWKQLDPAEDDWRCLQTSTYPACLAVIKGDWCLGVLPNILPLHRIQQHAPAQAAIDLGASCTTAALMLDGKPVPIKDEQLTRLLVMHQNMPADDFLLSLTPKEVTPSAVLLTGGGDTLFEDGRVYTVSRFDTLRDMIPGAVATQLKWRADSRSVRARRMLLHQVMLGVSLNAMLAGAQSIRWRVTVADEMGDEGRNALLNLVDETSIAVAQQSGLMLTDGKFTVTWAEEAAAIHAYLAGEGGMKGTFAVLDMGGSSTKLHLWMQGKNRPLGGAVLMEGASSVLLNALRRNPDMLRLDFADCGNEVLIASVSVLCAQLERAGESQAQSDKALLMLEALLDEFRPAIVQHLYNRFQSQQPTCMQAILLEMYAAAVFSVGLMLESAGQDTNINHLFPADLPICLTGRGAWLLETLTPQLRNGLQYIAHAPMALRHPVKTVTLRPSPLPALGVAKGMLKLKDTGRTIDTPIIRTRQSFSELMGILVRHMLQSYPAHMWLLHPGICDAWGNITPAAEDTVRRIASRVYGEGEDIPASVMQFMTELRAEPITPNMPAFPGE